MARREEARRTDQRNRSGTSKGAGRNTYRYTTEVRGCRFQGKFIESLLRRAESHDHSANSRSDRSDGDDAEPGDKQAIPKYSAAAATRPGCFKWKCIK